MRISVFTLPILIIMMWLEGALPLFVMLFSATMHEIGHITAVYMLGYRIRRIDILPMGAVIVVPEGIPDISEFKIALCGPLASLFCAFVCAVWFIKVGSVISLFALLVNFVFGIINLLPIHKLDGGKALFCYLSHKQKKSAERICSAVSVCAKMMFVTLCGLSVILSGFNLGVILLSVALILQIV
ncbi:MAG: site-2 protease family protein [Clostridia bacterium]|nr:site-2 protease family protein [Clostridia bacterium]